MVSSFLLSVVLLLATSFVIGEIFERIGLDAIIGYLLAGLLLGPSVLGVIDPSVVHEFAMVGAVLILFMAGLKEKSAAEIYKNKKSVAIGLSLLIGTFISVFVTVYLMGSFNIIQILFFALAFSVVDLGVPAKFLMSAGLLDTDFGRSALNIGVINVVAGFILLVLLTLFFNPVFSVVVKKLVSVLGFVVLFLVLHHLLSKFSRQTELLESEAAQFTMAFILVFFLAYLTETLGFSSILGAFLGGIVVGRTKFSESREFSESIKGVAFGFFIPLFFGWFGLELELWGSHGIIANLGPALLIISVAVVSKFVIAYVGSRLENMESPGIVASSVLSLDVESLVILMLGLQLGVFVNKSALSIFAPAIPITTLTITVLFIIFGKGGSKKSKKSREWIPSSLHLHHYYNYLKEKL